MRSRVAVQVEEGIVPEQAPWRLRPGAAHTALRMTVCALQEGARLLISRVHALCSISDKQEMCGAS